MKNKWRYRIFAIVVLASGVAYALEIIEVPAASNVPVENANQLEMVYPVLDSDELYVLADFQDNVRGLFVR